jgi:hypothetical protein
MIMIRKSEMYKKAKFYKICSFLFAVAMLVTMGAQRTIQVQAAPPQAAPQNFNNHACSDLIIGVPGEEFPPNINDNAGALHVVWSNSDHSGFHASGAQLWYQGASTDGASILDSMESGDQFARSLAAGDFNHDGYYDVAVGVPYEDVMVGGSGATDAGAVNVLYASAPASTSFGRRNPPMCLVWGKIMIILALRWLPAISTAMAMLTWLWAHREKMLADR